MDDNKYANQPAGSMLAIVGTLGIIQTNNMLTVATERMSGHGVASTTVRGGDDEHMVRFLTRVTSPDGAFTPEEHDDIHRHVEQVLAEAGYAIDREEPLPDSEAHHAGLSPAAGDFASIIHVTETKKTPFRRPNNDWDEVISNLCEMPDDPERPTANCPAEALMMAAISLNPDDIDLAYESLTRAKNMLQAVVTARTIIVTGMDVAHLLMEQVENKQTRNVVRGTVSAILNQSQVKVPLACGDLLLIDATDEEVSTGWWFNPDYDSAENEEWNMDDSAEEEDDWDEDDDLWDDSDDTDLWDDEDDDSWDDEDFPFTDEDDQ